MEGLFHLVEPGDVGNFEGYSLFACVAHSQEREGVLAEKVGLGHSCSDTRFNGILVELKIELYELFRYLRQDCFNIPQHVFVFLLKALRYLQRGHD